MAEKEEQTEWEKSEEARQLDSQIQNLQQKKENLKLGAATGKRMSRKAFDRLDPRSKSEFMQNGGQLYD